MEELKPGGAQIPVTESNKKEYLDLLAQYRLATSVKQEIEAFVKGMIKKDFTPRHKVFFQSTHGPLVHSILCVVFSIVVYAPTLSQGLSSSLGGKKEGIWERG